MMMMTESSAHKHFRRQNGLFPALPLRTERPARPIARCLQVATRLFPRVSNHNRQAAMRSSMNCCNPQKVHADGTDGQRRLRPSETLHTVECRLPGHLTLETTRWHSTSQITCIFSTTVGSTSDLTP